MRLIDVDVLIENLEYDVELDARALDDADLLIGINRDLAQFDKDCKQNAVDMLKKAPTVDAIPFKWTPCSERLPKETGTYLVTINYHGNTYVSMDNFSPSGWELTGWTGLATRLAWAKVPEPYKGETE